MPETFSFIASYGTVRDAEPRLNQIKFGDGYEQISPDGINNNPLKFNVVFSKRNSEEAAAIVAFFEARKGVESFLWLPPAPYASGGTKLFRCKKWTHDIQESNNESITCMFEQVFGLG